MGLLVVQLKQALRILRHPIDGFWELRYEKRASLLSAFVLIVLVYIVSIVSKIVTGYIFDPVDVKFLNPYTMLGRMLFLLLSWIVANYLISSINKGQGRLVDVMIGSAYALAPYILFSIPLALLSNVLTLGESSIYHFGGLVITAWTVFLLFVSVQEVHNYSIGETVRVCLLSLCFMAIIWLLMAVLIGLTVQFVDFLNQVGVEVKYR